MAIEHEVTPLSTEELVAMGAAIFNEPPEKFVGMILIGVTAEQLEPPMLLSSAPTAEALKLMLCHLLYSLLQDDARQ